MIEISTEWVRWFADYHAKEPSWGVFHVSLADGNYQIGAADLSDAELASLPGDVGEAIDWFDRLDENERIALAQRVRTLELVRQHDAPVAITATMPARRLDGDELIAGRLTEGMRRVFYAMAEAVQVADGPVTIAEAMLGRTSHPNTFRSRASELYHLGALVKGELRQCRVAGRQALTWTPVAPPWTPVPGTRSTSGILRPLLRESADMLERAANMLEGGAAAREIDRLTYLDQLRARVAEYRAAASNEYTLERKDA